MIRFTVLMMTLAVLGGCAGADYDPFVAALDRQMARRSYQVRSFEGVHEIALMRAVVRVLQDHHFRLQKVDHAFGAVTAYQSTGYDRPSDLGGRLYITVLLKREDAGTVRVRASMRTGIDNPDEPLLYQQFFAALDRALRGQANVLIDVLEGDPELGAASAAALARAGQEGAYWRRAPSASRLQSASVRPASRSTSRKASP